MLPLWRQDAVLKTDALIMSHIGVFRDGTRGNFLKIVLYERYEGRKAKVMSDDFVRTLPLNKLACLTAEPCSPLFDP